MPGEVIKDMAISMTTIGMADCSIETRKWEGAWEKWGEGGGGGHRQRRGETPCAHYETATDFPTGKISDPKAILVKLLTV